MRPRIAVQPPAPQQPLIDTSQMSPPASAMADIVNNVTAPFQQGPDPKKGTAGVIEHGMGAVLGVVSAPFELLDTGFALLTAPLAAMVPGMPAATLQAVHVGLPHGHAHAPSFGVPLPSVGTVMCAGCVSVLIGGVPAARASDVGLALTCFSLSPAFEIYTGSSNTFIGGSRAARRTDVTRHCNPASAVGKLGAAMGAAGVVVGAVGSQASDNAGLALQASMQAAQASADAVALAMSLLLGKDPGAPLAIGGVTTGNDTVLIGGFPLPDLLGVLGGALKAVGKIGKKLASSPRVHKALSKVGLCNSPGEPVHPHSGVVYNDFEDYAHPDGFLWERHYKSSWNEEDGPFGYGFRHFYQRHLLLLRTQVVYEVHDGERVFIPRRQDDRDEYVGFVADAGFELEETGPGRYELRTDRDELLTFEAVRGYPPRARLVRYRSGTARVRAGKPARTDLFFSYDDLNRLRSLTEVAAGTSVDTALIYDDDGRIVEVQRGERFHSPQVISRYQYENGCLARWQDAAGHCAYMRYDSQRRMVQGTNRNGYSFFWEYDGVSGRCTKAFGEDGLWGIEATYAGDHSSFVERDGGEWYFKHYADGVISQLIDPFGGILEYQRDERGKVTEQILPSGRRIKWFYDEWGEHYGRADEWGNPLAPEQDDPRLPDPFEHDGPLTARDWLWGRPLALLRERLEGHEPSVLAELQRLGPLRIGELAPPPAPRRDVMGRPLERIEGGKAVESYEYDAEGNRVAIRDDRGNRREQSFGSWNLLSAQKSALGHVVSYEYTHRERLEALTDPNGNRTEYERDTLQRIVGEARAGAVYQSRLYDHHGAVVEERAASGEPLRTVINGEHGRPIEEQLASGEVYRFDYDACGRVCLASSTQHEVRLGHLRELRTLDQRDGKGVEHCYESWLGVRSTRYFGRFEVTYCYEDGGVAIRTPEGSVHRIQSDARGLVLRENGNGIAEVCAYDEVGRLCTRVVYDSISLEQRWSTRYFYSGSGELLRTVDSQHGPTEYEYDADHRLVLAQGAGGKSEYAWDPAGNLLQAPGAAPIHYTRGNRIHMVGIVLYEHDEQGRRSAVVDAAGERTEYHYDSRGQLLQVTWSDRDQKWTAAYDGLGRRLWRQYGSEKGGFERTDFYWDGDRLAAERFADGQLRLYVYANEDAVVPFCFLEYENEDADPTSGVLYYLYTAPSGQPLRVEDSRFYTVWQAAKQEPFGNIELAKKSALKHPLHLRFAGHFYDPYLKLHYNRFRDYDPLTGRYLQPDPIGHDGGVNLYAYPPNPLVDVDLRGLIHKKATPDSTVRDSGTEGVTNRTRPVDSDASVQRLLMDKLDEDEVFDTIQRKRHNERLDYLLTDEEYLAIYGYTTGLYQPINGAMRAGNAGEWKPLVDKATTGLEKMRNNGYRHEGPTMRNIDLSDQLVGDLFCSGSFQDPAFLSSTSKVGGVFDGNVAISAQSKSGVDVSSISALGDKEMEVLYSPGTQFQVTSMARNPETQGWQISMVEK